MKTENTMSIKAKNKCRFVIHLAAFFAGVAGALPIPMSDAIPITTVQIGMIISLGKIFDITLSDSAAKALANVIFLQQSGRSLASGISKYIPERRAIAKTFVRVVTAVTLTEIVGWIIADNFYCISKEKEFENIVEILARFQPVFNDLRYH